MIELRHINQTYQKQALYDIDLTITSGEIVGVVGKSGSGKSTLLKLIAGATEPDDGMVTVGGSVKMGYFAQHAMDLLDGERTVFQSLEDSFPQAGQGSLRALAGCFGFSGDEIELGAVKRLFGAAIDGGLRSRQLFITGDADDFSGPQCFARSSK